MHIQKELVLQFPRGGGIILTSFLWILNNIMAILCQKVIFLFCSQNFIAKI